MKRAARMCWWSLVSGPLVGVMLGCQGADVPLGDDPPNPPSVDPGARLALSGPLARLLNKELAKHTAAARGMTYEGLMARYPASHDDRIRFKVTDAKYYREFTTAFALGADARQRLATLGFVVVPNISPYAKGPADVYYRVFAEDLPVFISADSILHAWHRSFDWLVEATESLDLAQTLRSLLSRSAAALTGGTQADLDALFYLSVARSLLDGTPAPAAVQGEVNTYLGHIKGRRICSVVFMGVPTFIDFTQFVPRGHYTHSEVLKKYFMAMMWLGRTDLVLYDPKGDRPREEAAARALAGAMKRAGALPLFQHLDAFYRKLVGGTNALTPEAMLDLCQQAGLPDCVGKPAAMASVYVKQAPAPYSSRVFDNDTPPVTMRFFPQRFAYGAWVTTQTTTPRLTPTPGGRAMAMPEDVAFALGSNRALHYFAEDMKLPQRERLPATLHGIRQTMLAIPPARLEETVFNNWLEALMALSQPGISTVLPRVMRTTAWHDRKLEAVLASWAELRHDTILVVEQSTGGGACQYPDGYVEPVPGLYRSLDKAARITAEVFAAGGYKVSNVATGMAHWRTVLARLAAMADKELADQPMSAEDLAFLNKTMDEHTSVYLGRRSYNGWYPQLFPAWYPSTSFESGKSKPIVADVHTDAENGRALHVATSHPGLMILAVDRGGDLTLYGGPVSSYYSLIVDADKRLTDDKWKDKITTGDLPPRPPFAQTYWVD